METIDSCMKDIIFACTETEEVMVFGLNFISFVWNI